MSPLLHQPPFAQVDRPARADASHEALNLSEFPGNAFQVSGKETKDRTHITDRAGNGQPTVSKIVEEVDGVARETCEPFCPRTHQRASATDTGVDRAQGSSEVLDIAHEHGQ